MLFRERQHLLNKCKFTSNNKDVCNNHYILLFTEKIAGVYQVTPPLKSHFISGKTPGLKLQVNCAKTVSLAFKRIFLSRGGATIGALSNFGIRLKK